MNSRKKSILIVEDIEEQALLLRSHLGQDNYSIRLASDGLEALKLIMDEKPDLIISDIMMPDMDGVELCRRIKSNSSFKNIPVILVTASWKKKDFIDGLEARADYFFLKPCDKKFLKFKVEEIFNANQVFRSDDEAEGSPSLGADPDYLLRRLQSLYEFSVLQNLKNNELQIEIKKLRDQVKVFSGKQIKAS